MDFSKKHGNVPGRREHPRRAGDRPDSEDRRQGERRTSTFRRKLVDVLHAHQLPKVADVVKTTKLIEPLITVVTLVLSGLTNTAVLGWSTACGLMFALSFHEFGHFRATKKVGYTPQWWWFIPLLGAVMRLPDIRTRSHEAQIAYGGPFFGLIFTVIVGALWFGATCYSGDSLWKVAEHFLFTTAFVSVALNLFNLIPISPLDGGRVAQGMDGAWPKWMRLAGFATLIVVTAVSGQATMLVVWILVIGEVRLSFRGVTLDKKWRFYFSALLFIVMFMKLAIDGVTGRLSGWNLFGESAYTLLAVYILRGYRREWKHPKLYVPSYELRLRPVNQREGVLIRLRYFSTLALLIAAFILLVNNADRMH